MTGQIGRVRVSPAKQRLATIAADLNRIVYAAHDLNRLVIAAADVLSSGNKILAFGNGGSAADAQHLCAELVGRFDSDREALPAVALTSDGPVLTALGNDFGFDQVFARQIAALAQPGDLALAISTRGRSPNVLRGVERARAIGLVTAALTGSEGAASPLGESVDVCIAVPFSATPRIQEAHGVIVHVFCELVEDALGFASLEEPREQTSAGLLTIEEAKVLRGSLRTAGKRVVWTNGCFDILHVGHLRTLEYARTLGDALLVGVNSDASARRLKGPSRPIVGQAERAALVAALRPVDAVILLEEDDPRAALRALQPDVHCKGADYQPETGKAMPEREDVLAYGGRVEYAPLVVGHSTSALIELLSARPETT